MCRPVKKLRTHWACVVTWNGWKINREANSSFLPSSRNSALLKILLTPNIPNLNHFHVGETESFLNTQKSYFHNEEGGKFCQIAQFFFLLQFCWVVFSDSSSSSVHKSQTSWKSPFEIWNIFHFFGSRPYQPAQSHFYALSFQRLLCNGLESTLFINVYDFTHFFSSYAFRESDKLKKDERREKSL